MIFVFFKFLPTKITLFFHMGEILKMSCRQANITISERFHRRHYFCMENMGCGSAAPKLKAEFSFAASLAFRYICRRKNNKNQKHRRKQIMPTTTTTKNKKKTTAQNSAKTGKISKTGLFMQTRPKGIILDMRAVLK